MSDVSLSCRCGSVRGKATDIDSSWGRRVVCMCYDCQAFARHLGQERTTLDDNGGTDIYQLTPKQIKISQGADNLACLKLTPKGILRWYASCCNTPIGNTMPSAQFPFVGMPHTFMNHAADGQSRDGALGHVAFWLNAASGHGDIPSQAHRTVPFAMIMSTMVILLLNRIGGKHKPSPFFNAATGAPVAEPLVLAKA